MLKISNIDHMNLNVKNLNESLNFYNQLFGMEVKEQGVSESGRKFVITGLKDKLYLALYEDSHLEEPHINHFGVHVENFDEVKDRLEQLGIPINYGGAVNWGKSKSIYINDPNGLEIELTEVFGGGLS